MEDEQATSALHTNDLELHVPQSRGAAVAVVVGVLFLAVFVWLAAANLLASRGTPWTSLIGSALWIVLVVFCVIGIARGNGVRASLVRVVGNFSVRHFARIATDPSGAKSFHYGFRLGHRTFDYLHVELHGIRSVNWSAGQASYMRGKDCDDWSVALWCAKASVKTPLGSWERITPEYIEIIGQPGCRDAADSLGRAVAKMLISAGLPLYPDGSGCGYRREMASCTAPPCE